MYQYKFYLNRIICIFLTILSVLVGESAWAQCNNFIKISPGFLHTIGIKSDSSLWVWGQYTYDEIADSLVPTTINSVPVQVGTDHDWADIASGWGFSIAIKHDGSMWGWGSNLYGQLGMPIKSETNILTKCSTDSNWLAVCAGTFHVLGIKKNGSLWSWGARDYGQLGRDYTYASTYPVQVGTDSNWMKIAAGWHNSFGIKKDSSLWGWGKNNMFSLGDSIGGEVSEPHRIDSMNKWLEIATSQEHSIGIQANGSLWAWGSNDVGQLGQGSRPPWYKKTPARIGSDTDWHKVASGVLSSFALKKDGKLWSWGDGLSGILGIGRYSREYSPVAVEPERNWVNIFASEYNFFTNSNDGGLWACGFNYNGSLGLGVSSASIKILGKVNGPPQILGNLSACMGNTEILYSLDSSGISHPWSSADTSIVQVSDEGTITTIAPGKVNITFRNREGCETTVLFKVNPLPDFSGIKQGCIGDSVLWISADTPFVYPWESSDIGIARVSDKGVITALRSGKTLITFIDKNGCRKADTFSVLKATAIPSVSTPVIYCQNSSPLLLDASGTSIKWYSSDTAHTFSLSAPLASTLLPGDSLYFLSQTDTITGCESKRISILVRVHPKPSPPLVVSPVAYCQDALTSDLTATGSNLKWYMSDTSSTWSIVAPRPDSKIVSDKYYFVSQTNSFDCESEKDSINVSIKETPGLPKIASPVNLCFGAIADSLVAEGLNLKWYDSESDTTAEINAPVPVTSVLDSFHYYVSQTNANLCEGKKVRVDVIIHPLPEVSLSTLNPAGLVFCRNSSILLKAIPSTLSSLAWYYIDTLIPFASSETLAVAKEGKYSIIISDAYNCKNKDSVYVSEDSSVVPILKPLNALLCIGESQLFVVEPSLPG